MRDCSSDKLESRLTSAWWHALTPEALVNTLQSNLDSGLTTDEARERLAQHGPNALPESPPPAPLTVFLAQFASLIVWVLLGAALVSGLLREWVDAAAILAIVLLNALLASVNMVNTYS